MYLFVLRTNNVFISHRVSWWSFTHKKGTFSSLMRKQLQHICVELSKKTCFQRDSIEKNCRQIGLEMKSYHFGCWPLVSPFTPVILKTIWARSNMFEKRSQKIFIRTLKRKKDQNRTWNKKKSRFWGMAPFWHLILETIRTINMLSLMNKETYISSIRKKYFIEIG